jgi:hypothetical protein
MMLQSPLQLFEMISEILLFNIFLAAMNYLCCQSIILSCAHLLVFLPWDRLEVVKLD